MPLFLLLTHITHLHITYKLIRHHRMFWLIPSFNFKLKRTKMIIIFRRRRARWWRSVRRWLRICKGANTICIIWTFGIWITGALTLLQFSILSGLNGRNLKWNSRYCCCFFFYINRFNTRFVKKQLLLTFLSHFRRINVWSMDFDLF